MLRSHGPIVMTLKGCDPAFFAKVDTVSIVLTADDMAVPVRIRLIAVRSLRGPGMRLAVTFLPIIEGLDEHLSR